MRGNFVVILRRCLETLLFIMKRIVPLGLIFCMILLSGNAQTSLQWENLGPDNLGSPTRALAFLPDGRLLAGSQGGGLWFTDSDGNSWQRWPTYNGNPNITSILVSGQNIYVATGATAFTPSPYALTNANYDFRNQPEGFLGYLKGLPGSGVWVSRDGGTTWSNANATTSAAFNTLNFKGPFVSIQKIFKSGERIFIATAEGLFYSDDDLATVVKSEGSNRFKNSVVFDIEASGNTIFAGTSIDSLFISTDNGNTFRGATNSVFFSQGRFNDQRVEIAVAPSNPNVVYVGSVAPSGTLKGLFRSDDGGQNWRTYAPQGSANFGPLATSGREAFVIAVMPDNPDEVILAGDAWFTYTNTRGWTQTAQHTNPASSRYIPTRIYAVLFESSASRFWIGTERQIIKSFDRGVTFRQRSKGYEAAVTYTVTSYDALGNDAVIAGTPGNGIVYNNHFTASNPLVRQGFGVISTRANSELQSSYLYPGGLVTQGTDGGPRRSLSGGDVFENFYGFPTLPQVRNLLPATSDTIIDRNREGDEGGGMLNQVGASGPRFLPMVLDEFIPASVVGNPNLTAEQIRAQSSSYLFFASGNYIWMATGAFGDLLDVRMNRISRRLVEAPEYITALAVSGDQDHYLWVGTSAGKLFRLNNPTRLSGFDALNDVIQVNNQVTSNLLGMTGRWITSIALDPTNADRVAVTYGGFGGNVATTQSFIWFSENGKSATPFFGVLNGAPREPMYAARFITDPNNAQPLLLVGSESGLNSVSGILSAGPGVPLFLSTWKDELSTVIGRIPVYDINVRRYRSILTNEDTRDFMLERDNTVFIATHGRGVWSTSSLKFNRQPGEAPVELLPEAFAANLLGNPAEGMLPELSVEFPAAGQFSAQVFTLDGRKVSTLPLQDMAAGQHTLTLKEGAISAGIYLVRIDAVIGGKAHQQTLKACVQP